ncbi:MAG TPA: phosphoenolpyruvate--protein phosphotransferase [Gemmatimonadaceae bacterium]|jgi:phosphotransferase system enzyme I (PtsI)|nr:phosphoenolpyruvate--protein phosphotransferase [Gemmatimonadaceae bacterium]
MDRRLTGIPASPGIVVGQVHVLLWEVPEVPQRIIDDEAIAAEIQRFHAALEQARERLRTVRARAARHAGEEEARIFDAQLFILEDIELIGRVEGLIRQNLAAESAFEITMLEWRHHFARHASPMMRERVGDITDVQIRVLSLLLNLPDHDPLDLPKGAGVILVTHDLTPSLTVQVDREAVAAIATDAGTRVSHVAILARSLGLPAVVGLRSATARLRGGEMAILDGTTGMLWINPTDAEIEDFRERSRREAAVGEELAREAGAESVTTDGQRVTLYANVDIPEDAEAAARSGADGVGLMRTEFLVVGRTTMPDEEEQYRAYRRVVDSFGGRPVVIRTFDIGGDKLPVGGYPTEANPFLGWRAIRMCLDEPAVFRPQLRALMRAAVHGDLRIMLPLVVTVDEVRQTRELMATEAKDLASRGIPHRLDIPLGVMIETPAAAVAADSFVGEAAFFSIGTNDLTQYSLAVDRGNANIADRFTPLHPGVLRLIARTVEVGDANGLGVTVCGEMASEPLMAFALIGLGVRQLSVAPRAVPLVKRLVRGVATSDAAAAIEEALRLPTAHDVAIVLERRLRASCGADPFPYDGLPPQ